MYLARSDGNPFGTNCWVLAADHGRDAVVVDPGLDPEGIRSLLDGAGRRPAAVLLTHAHFDHASQAGELAGEEVPVFVHEDDAIAFEDVDAWDPGFDNPLAPVKDLRPIADGEVLRFAGIELEVHHAPGHTPGHCCFTTDATVISGDLVFRGSIGRSDFPNSSPADMDRSLRWFQTLHDGLDVLPGHGEPTTVAHERASNLFLIGPA